MDLLQLSKNATILALEKLHELDKKNIKNYKFSSEISRELKADADLIIENILISELAKSGLNILSEEQGLKESDSTSKLTFIIDPIDGTVNFVRGIINCSISIALFDGEKPIFGVLGSYPSNSIAWGGKDIGSFMEEIPLKVSTIKEIDKSVLCSGFPSRFDFSSNKVNQFINQIKNFNKIRMLGSASQSLLHLAKGSVEVYLENNIMIWDVAAGIAIVEGAGGEYRLSHNEFIYPLDVIASNNKIENLIWPIK